MFEAGFLEMLVIGVLALVIVGPERLPGIARKVGKWVAKARALVNTTKTDIERELRADEMRNMLVMQEEKIRNLQNSFDTSVNTAGQQLDETIKKEVADAESLISSKSNESDTVEQSTADKTKRLNEKNDAAID